MTLPGQERRAGKPRVAVIGTGGTISGVGRHSLDLYEYMDYGRESLKGDLS